MINFLKKILGFSTVDISQLLSNGASILDVRTANEFANGHVQNSINIPLDQLAQQIEKIKKMPPPIITCCASGMRSASAKSILKAKGIETYNGGSWVSVNQKNG
jgi:phage shock protein E